MIRLLVVSPDAKWVEYLQIGLEAFDIEAECAPGLRSAGQMVDSFRSALKIEPFAGVLISALAAPGQNPSDALLEAVDVLDALRPIANGVRVLLWSAYPSERLSSIASRFPNTAILANDAPEAVAAHLKSASPHQGAGPRTARIELQVGAANIRTEIILDGQPVIVPSSRDWSGRYKLSQLEDRFLNWSPLKHERDELRYTDDWLGVLKAAGEDISYETEYAGKTVSDAISYCLDQVGTHDRIHVRFSLMSPGAAATNPFVHVPFELLYDPGKKDFVRGLAPIARRDCLNPDSRTATALPNIERLTGHTLFVKSDASGGYEFPGGERMFNPLQALGEEFGALTRSRADAEELALTVGGNALTQLQEKLTSAPSAKSRTLQIIHFAGHSIRVGDGTVYLILPGTVDGEVLPLRMSEFAAWCRQARTQLVILSSCESSAPESVFRLSQAGIPAVIGFRWEVIDLEAAFFTGQLHAELAKGSSLARAFHAALRAVRIAYPKTPTFVSPMLVVQDEEWTII
ncbi:CHAT domain-containing protein [Rhizobium ruizarguesonis]